MADSGNAGTVMDTDCAKSERLAAVPVPARAVVPNSEIPGAGLVLCHSASRPHPFNFENAAAMAPPIGAEADARFGFPASILDPPRRGGYLQGCDSQKLKLVFNRISLSLYGGAHSQVLSPKSYLPRQDIVLTTKPSARTPAKRSPVRSRNAKPRIAAEGDISPIHTRKGVEVFTVDEAVSAAQESKIVAVKDILSQAGNGSPELIESLKAILAGASPEDAEVLRNALLAKPPLGRPGVPFDPDGELAEDWREGGYPYKNLMSRKTYERQKYRLQVELLKLQAWVQGNRAEGGDPVRGPRRRRQGRHHQALHGAPQPARRARRRAGKADRDGTRPVVFPALRPASADARARSCCSTARGTTAPGSSG